MLAIDGIIKLVQYQSMSTTVKHSNLIPPPFYLTVGGGGNVLEVMVG